MKTIKRGSLKKASIVTIGNFDGLHKGHLALIKKVLELKKKTGLDTAVLTFNVNTKFSKNLIFPQNQLKEYLKELKTDYLTIPDFVKDIMGLSCEEFVFKYLVCILKAKYVVVGENFFFGKNKSGDAKTLKELGRKYGFKTVIIKSRITNGKIISSTLIREHLRNGEITKANKLMYRPFSFFGTVKKGYNIGSKILKIPTANMSLPKMCAEIREGVYITKTIIDNIAYNSITNIGKNPTNPKKAVTVETNILGFYGNIYGKRIKTEFLKYIRCEIEFSSDKALKRQIEKDIKRAEKFFGE